MKRISQFMFIAFVLGVLVPALSAQPKEDKSSQGRPPAPVMTSQVIPGSVIPEDVFIGTIYYPEVSQVASEVTGKVETVQFEEGQRVKKGSVLVGLDAQLIGKTIESKKASYKEVLSELQNAKEDYKRISKLYRDNSVAAQVYDEYRFKVQGLSLKAAALKADVERLEIEMEKKTISSPFDGVVIERKVDRGEWVSDGSVIGSVARDDEIDILVNVPDRIIRFVPLDRNIRIEAGGHNVEGKVFAVIPKGDVATRTIPVKIRMDNTASLIQGMEARVSLPSGEKRDALMVPRDSVINKFGRTVLFAVVDSAAKMLPVDILGYEGMMVGVQAQGLQEGMQVVVKGNERLTDAQPVQVITGQ